MASSGCEVLSVEDFQKWRDQVGSAPGALGAPQNQLTVGYIKGFASGIKDVFHKAAMNRLTTNGMLALDVDAFDETGYTGLILEFLRSPPMTRGYTGPRLAVVFVAKNRLASTRVSWDKLEAQFPGCVKLVAIDLSNEDLYKYGKGGKDDLSKVRGELWRVEGLPKDSQNNFLLGLVAMKLSKALRVLALGGDNIAALQAQALVEEDLPKYQKLKWLVYAVSRGQKETAWSLVNWASETDSPFMDGFKQGQDKTESLAFAGVADPAADLHAETKADPPAESLTPTQAANDLARVATETARQLAEEESRRVAEEESRRQLAEEESRRVAEAQAEIARKEAEEAQRVAEENARTAAEAEEAQRVAEENARRMAEEESWRAAEENAQRDAEESARRVAEEEYRQSAADQAEAVRRAAEEKAQRVAEENARRVAEEESTWRMEAQAQAARSAAEEESRRMADAQSQAAWKAAEEEAQKVAKEKVRRLAEEESRRVAEARAEVSRKAAEEEEEAQRVAEENARRKSAPARPAAPANGHVATEEEDVDPDVDMRAFTRQMNRLQKGDSVMLRGELESFATRLFAQLKLTEKPLAELRRRRVREGSRGGSRSPPGSPGASSRGLRESGGAAKEALRDLDATASRPRKTSWAPGSASHTAMRVSSRDAARRLRLSRGSPAFPGDGGSLLGVSESAPFLGGESPPITP